MDLQAQMETLLAKREATAKEKAALEGRKRAREAELALAGAIAQKIAKRAPKGDFPPVRTRETAEETLTAEDKVAIRKRLGLIRLEDFTTKHMTAREKALFNAARAGVDRFIKALGQGLFFVLVAGQVYTEGQADPRRTGYGCGKTALAKAAAHSLAKVTMEPGDWDSLAVQPGAKMLTAAQLMASFDDPEFDLGRIVNRKTKLLILDDIGREGALKYVAADAQQATKQARYFEVINRCYEWGIPLFITSNMRGPELADHLGGAAWSRIQEKAQKGFRFDLTGVPDYRPILGGHDGI